MTPALSSFLSNTGVANMISKWKKKRSEVLPPSVSDEGWVQFNAYWDAEDTKKKAETMSQNRNSETRGITPSVFE